MRIFYLANNIFGEADVWLVSGNRVFSYKFLDGDLLKKCELALSYEIFKYMKVPEIAHITDLPLELQEAIFLDWPELEPGEEDETAKYTIT